MKKTKVCSKCKVEKPLEDFHKRSGTRVGKPRAACATCANKERGVFQNRMRLKALGAYGAQCTCCGEKRVQFLCFDHINNDGADHRRSIFGHNTGGGHFAEWLIANNYPLIVQVLCHNCNMAKGFYGVCPHVLEREELAVA